MSEQDSNPKSDKTTTKCNSDKFLWIIERNYIQLTTKADLVWDKLTSFYEFRQKVEKNDTFVLRQINKFLWMLTKSWKTMLTTLKKSLQV